MGQQEPHHETGRLTHQRRIDIHSLTSLRGLKTSMLLSKIVPHTCGTTRCQSHMGTRLHSNMSAHRGWSNMSSHVYGRSRVWYCRRHKFKLTCAQLCLIIVSRGVSRACHKDLALARSRSLSWSLPAGKLSPRTLISLIKAFTAEASLAARATEMSTWATPFTPAVPLVSAILGSRFSFAQGLAVFCYGILKSAGVITKYSSRKSANRSNGDNTLAEAFLYS